MSFFSNHVFKLSLFLIFIAQPIHAQENGSQLKEHLIAVLPELIKTAPNILPAVDAPYTLEPDSIDVVWNLFKSGNLITSITSSIESIRDDGSKKYRFVKYTVRDKNEKEHHLFSYICITSLKNELDDHVRLYFQTLVNPESNEKYAVVIEKYFSGYVHEFY